MAATPDAASSSVVLRRRATGERTKETLFAGVMLLALLLSLGFLVVLMYDIISGAIPVLQERGTSFLTDKLSPRPGRTGLSQAIMGSLHIAIVTVAVAFPLGISTAIYLEEYAADNWFTRLVDVNIRNLAGVPSIVYGLLGLAIFVRLLGPGGFLNVSGGANGRTALAGGLTMALLVLPIVVITAAESIRAVPQSLREGGYGLGATRWEVTRKLVLPSAAPGMLTGMILSLARAIGETAPLLVIGAATLLTVDVGIVDFREEFTALPVIAFDYAGRPQAEFRDAVTPAVILVLMVFTLSLNSVAIWLRNHYEKKSA